MFSNISYGLKSSLKISIYDCIVSWESYTVLLNLCILEPCSDQEH